MLCICLSCQCSSKQLKLAASFSPLMTYHICRQGSESELWSRSPLPHFGEMYLNAVSFLCSLSWGLAMKQLQYPKGCDPGQVSKFWTHLKADGVNRKAPAVSDGSWTRQLQLSPTSVLFHCGQICPFQMWGEPFPAKTQYKPSPRQSVFSR